MIPRRAALTTCGLMTLGGLASLALVAPPELSPGFLVGLLGFGVAAAVSCLALGRVCAKDMRRAGVWFELIPFGVGLAWAAASWMQGLTGVWWNTRLAFGVQLGAGIVWAALAVVAYSASRHASQEEDAQAADLALREHEDALEQRFAKLRVAEVGLPAEPDPEAERQTVASNRAAPPASQPSTLSGAQHFER